MYSTDMEFNNSNMNFFKNLRVKTSGSGKKLSNTDTEENIPAYYISFIEDNFSSKYEMKEHFSSLRQSMSFIKTSVNYDDIYTYKIPSISNSLNKVIVSQEIKAIKSRDFDKLLNEILSELIFQLIKFEQKDNTEIKVEISRDLEIPDWEEFVISIKLLSMDYMNYEEFFALWKNIDKSIRERICLIKDIDKQTLEKYGKPIIVLEEPE